MTRTFSFRCATCGKQHRGSPSFGYSAPFHWNSSYENDPDGACRLTRDLCVIERRDYFVRCILEVPIHNVREPFLWGVWISQSEKNFQHYAETFPNSPKQQTFGYFCNRLPDYSDTLNLYTLIHWWPGKLRPLVELEPGDHPLYRDWSEGISWERAIELAPLNRHRED